MNRSVFTLARKCPYSPEKNARFELQAIDVQGAEHADEGNIIAPDCVCPNTRRPSNRSSHFCVGALHGEGGAGVVTWYASYGRDR